jgi:hypothetical protein
MSRTATAVLLVLAGLAVGLWLGFNPRAHQETIQTWDRTRAAIVHAQTTTTVKVGATKPTAAAKPTTSTQPTASITWKQITTAFDVFWLSLQKLWLNVSARIGTIR